MSFVHADVHSRGHVSILNPPSQGGPTFTAISYEATGVVHSGGIMHNKFLCEEFKQIDSGLRTVSTFHV